MSWYIVEHTPGRNFARFATPLIGLRYQLVLPSGEQLPEVAENENVVIQPLGHGGFGRVVRVKDEIGLDRAIKLIDRKRLIDQDRDDFTSQYFAPGYQASLSDADALSARFQGEIKHTNARPFQHILPILDYGKTPDADGREFVFYVSAFLPGATLDGFLRNRIPDTTTPHKLGRRDKALLHDLILSLIDDLLAAIEELHDAGVIHMDIKPSNMMVLESPDGERRDFYGPAYRSFLIDLGAARSSRNVDPNDRVPLIVTPYFFPYQLFDRTDYVDGYVRGSALARVGSTVDLYAAGRTLERLLLDRFRRRTPRVEPTPDLEQKEKAKEHFWREVLDDDFDVIEGLIARLMATDGEAFESPVDARLAFQTVGRRDSHSVFASRALTDQARGLRIRLGRRLVCIAPPFDQIVEHPTFQRLKRLQQLTLLSEIFPEATHTRFSHVLCTYDTAKRFLMGLNRDVRFRLTFTRRDVDHVLAAALLHDLGQYAFSHSIEDLRKVGDKFDIPYLSEIRHDQELASEYLDIKPPQSHSIKEILAEAGYDSSEILYMFQKTEKDPVRGTANIGRDLISGAIDVDRVSYLIQDSARTGVPYGRTVDLDLLVEALCIRGEPNGAPLIAIDEVGVSAVEAILTGVYWMYRNVYWRHTNRGFMAALKHVMFTLMEARLLNFRQYESAVYGLTDWEAMGHLRKLYAEYRKGVHEEVYDPLLSISEGRRFGYRRVFSLGYEDGKTGKLYEEVVQKASPAAIRGAIAEIVESLPKALCVRHGEILIDVPLKKRLWMNAAREGADGETKAERGASPVLWVRRRDHIRRKEWWQSLHEYSPLAALIGKIEDHSGRKIRVFFARELLGRLSADTIETLGERVKIALENMNGPSHGDTTK